MAYEFHESTGPSVLNNPSTFVVDDDCVVIDEDIPVIIIDDDGSDSYPVDTGVVSTPRQPSSESQSCGTDEKEEPPLKRCRRDMKERDACICVIKCVSTIEEKLIQELAKLKALRTSSHDLENLWLTLIIFKLEKFIAQPHVCDYRSTVVRCKWCETASRDPRIPEVLVKCEFLKLGSRLEKLLFLNTICHGEEEQKWIWSKITETRQCLSGLKKCFIHLNKTVIRANETEIKKNA